MGIFSWLFGKKEENKLVIKVPQTDINFFKKKAEEKINTERWVGRRKDIKINNFVNCWITEEAFKNILMKKGIWFRHRGMYVGDASGSVMDFEVKLNGKIKSICIRSINEDSLKKWKSVAYPDDRFRDEKEKIADYTVACHNSNGNVMFLGMIEKRRLLEELSNSRRIYSKMNQEYFRTTGLDKFRFDRMMNWISDLEKVE